jgi:hypothetical protein
MVAPRPSRNAGISIGFKFTLFVEPRHTADRKKRAPADTKRSALGKNKMFIQIIGWLFVIGLIGSAIYSSLFHIGNFFRQKRKIQNGEVYTRLHKQFNWKFLIVTQFIKLFVAGLIIYFFLITSK